MSRRSRDNGMVRKQAPLRYIRCSGKQASAGDLKALRSLDDGRYRVVLLVRIAAPKTRRENATDN